MAKEECGLNSQIGKRGMVKGEWLWRNQRRLRRCRQVVMRIVSFNCRGLGGRTKRSTVRELVCKEKVEFLCLQETKTDMVDDRLAYVILGSKDCAWVYSGADGASEGLCCIWDKDVFVRTDLWGDRGVPGVSGLWKGVLVHIVNIYAPCSREGKLEVWNSLVSRMRGKENER